MAEQWRVWGEKGERRQHDSQLRVHQRVPNQREARKQPLIAAGLGHLPHAPTLVFLVVLLYRIAGASVPPRLLDGGKDL